MFPASWGERERGRACTAPTLLLAASGAALLLAVGGLRPTAMLSAAALAGAGVLAAFWQARREATQPVRAGPSGQQLEAPTPVDALWSASAPVWIRQIETARGAGDEEVAALSRVFGALVARLDRITQDGGGAADERDAVAALSGHAAELESLVGALRSVQESKQSMVDEIGRAAARLKESAAEMREVALLTRMLALNATIEAARAGAAGRAFSVVVADMRELATRTATASEDFSRQTDTLHALVTSSLEDQAGGAGSIAWAQELVEKVVRNVESDVVRLTGSISALADERREVRADISRVLVSLQFQDRVSQILAHVSGNLQELLQRDGADDAHPADTSEWLQQLARSYSTPEEFGNLDAAPRKPAPEAESVTYF